jgi:hypothetical protein
MSNCPLPADDPEPDAAEPGPSYPCVQGLIAANVALMTAYANPAPGARVNPEAQRRLLARKVVSNLFFLREHPLLSPPLRQVMDHALRHWQGLAAPVLEPAWAGSAAAPAWRH